jgi:DNA-binding NarL/FixJ family response regulator
MMHQMTYKDTIQIILADDQAPLRSALHLWLEQEAHLRVVGQATDVSSLLAQIAQTHPDLILLDWELPGMSADSILPLLHQQLPDAQIIALSSRPEARQAALAAHVDAFVSKGDPPEQLLAAIGMLFPLHQPDS